MTDHSGLIARLRDFENEGVTASDRFHLRNEAATALSTLTAENKELRTTRTDQFFRISRLQGERDALAGALRELVTADDDYANKGGNFNRERVGRAWGAAHALLSVVPAPGDSE